MIRDLLTIIGPVPPVIVNVKYGLNSEGNYAVTCTTSGSPPTSVTWTRNGVPVSKDENVYKTIQILVDRNETIYENLLVISGSFEDVIGEYSCTVENSLETSGPINKTIKGL